MAIVWKGLTRDELEDLQFVKGHILNDTPSFIIDSVDVLRYIEIALRLDKELRELEAPPTIEANGSMHFYTQPGRL